MATGCPWALVMSPNSTCSVPRRPSPAVAPPRQGTVGTLHIGGCQVVQHQPTGLQVTLGQPLLDPFLPLQQPVQRPIEVILGGLLHPQGAARLVDPHSRVVASLDARVEHSGHNHGQYQVPLMTGFWVQQDSNSSFWAVPG